MTTIEWKAGPPPDKKKQYLAKSSGYIVTSVRYRYGLYGEPSQDTLAWRCDCCGRFGGTFEWAEMP